MKLLIVDDEVNTRKGIMSRLPLSDMGITEVCEADDGINGLKAVSTFAPDIILTDVRMPRMDGVEMMYKIKEQFPSCLVIFMSGYSDKKYLKSAIELKALKYIEKPINMNELKSALQSSISLYEDENYKKELLKASLSLIRNELALKLIFTKPDWSVIASNIKTSGLDIPTDGLFVNILIHINLNIVIEQINGLKTLFDNIFEYTYRITRLSGIWAIKNEEHIIVHLFANKCDRHLFSNEKLTRACHIILEELSSSFPVFLSLGKTVYGIQNLYSSYESAVLGIQRAFYYDLNCLVKPCDTNNSSFHFTPQIIRVFSEALQNEDQIKTRFVIKSLTSDIKRCDTTLVSVCKDFYYRLLLELVNSSLPYGFKLQEIPANNTDIWEMFLNFKTLTELENFILRQINLYFEFIESTKMNNRAVISTIQYIKNHFHEDDMSISHISDHARLSPSYISSVFKKNTGKPLVKYINDFRVEKAKELLHNKKLRINDVAVMVGCKDSNYFTRIFRKTCGLTPSEYRERIH